MRPQDLWCPAVGLTLAARMVQAWGCMSTGLRPGAVGAQTGKQSLKAGPHSPPPDRLTPITLPALLQPFVTIGAPVPQIPCWHGPQQSPPQMPDIRLQAIPQQPKHQSVSCPCGGVHIQGVRAHVWALTLYGRKGIRDARTREASSPLPDSSSIRRTELSARTVDKDGPSRIRLVRLDSDMGPPAIAGSSPKRSLSFGSTPLALIA